MLSLGLFCAAVVFGVYFVLLDRSIGITMLATVAALVLSFFFTAVASYIVGLVGNSNSPVSGMTISAVLLTGLMLWVGDYSGRAGILAMLGVAGVVCCVACTAGDVCNDLKTGQLVGASPRSQQIAQVLGVLVAASLPLLAWSLLPRPPVAGSSTAAVPVAEVRVAPPRAEPLALREEASVERVQESALGPSAIAGPEAALRAVQGSLTVTLWGAGQDTPDHRRLIRAAERIAGRVLFAGVPTGVAVTAAQQHGGPWPASTQPFTTSVGYAAIDRFLRPVALQDAPEWLVAARGRA